MNEWMNELEGIGCSRELIICRTFMALFSLGNINLMQTPSSSVLFSSFCYMPLGLKHWYTFFSFIFIAPGKICLAYDTCFTIEIYVGLLGYGTINTLQLQKQFKIIAKYGENFIFTCTRAQIGTQNFSQNFSKVIKCPAMLIYMLIYNLVCTIKHFIWTSADLFFHRVGN